MVDETRVRGGWRRPRSQASALHASTGVGSRLVGLRLKRSPRTSGFDVWKRWHAIES